MQQSPCHQRRSPQTARLGLQARAPLYVHLLCQFYCHCSQHKKYHVWQLAHDWAGERGKWDAHLSKAAHRFFSGRYFPSCSARNCAFSCALVSRTCPAQTVRNETNEKMLSADSKGIEFFLRPSNYVIGTRRPVRTGFLAFARAAFVEEHSLPAAAPVVQQHLQRAPYPALPPASAPPPAPQSVWQQKLTFPSWHACARSAPRCWHPSISCNAATLTKIQVRIGGRGAKGGSRRGWRRWGGGR